MTEALSASAAIPSELPLVRGGPFDPPGELVRIREKEPISRLSYPDGHQGWLVTSHALARAVLADPRFSNRQELRRTPIRHPLAQERRVPAEPGMFLRMDPPDHTRYRRLLAGQFTVRRMNLLEPRITQITQDRLAEMERAGSPVDLVQTFALPIPSLVICELLGVPYDERDRFQRDTAVIVNLGSTAEQILAAFAGISAYLRELVARKRAEPADDVLSGLLAGGELTEEEVANIGLLLLVAGHETTANMLALGTFTLLSHPEQAAALRADPSLAASAVEELLRYLSIIHIGPVRTALADARIGGRLVRAGESVTVSVPAANRDPERFDDPDELDLARSATGHVAFGHGVHQCLGQQLARVEMRIGYSMLFQRFPALRLAVPHDEVPLRDDMMIYGVHRLPVAW